MNTPSSDILRYKATFEKIMQLLPELNKQKNYKAKLDLWLLNGLGFEHFSIPTSVKQEFLLFQQNYLIDGELPHPISFIEPRTLDELNIFKRYYFNWWFQIEEGFEKRKDFEIKYKKWHSEGSEIDIHTITRDSIEALEKRKNLMSSRTPTRFLPANEAAFYMLGYNSSMYDNKDEFLDTPSSKDISVIELYQFCRGYNDQQIYQFLRKELVITEQKIIKGKHKHPKKTAIKTLEFLLDIWEGTNEEYEKILAELKKAQARPEPIPFIEDKEGKLTWNKYPMKGFVQYIKGFLYTCIEKGWIKKNKYSAPQFKTIVKNTFNVDVNLEPFKTMHTLPNSEYIKPFKHMPQNNK